MAKRVSRNNVLAGGLVVFSILAGAGVIVQLAGWGEFAGRANYVVEFDLSESVAGLKKGAEVRLGGRKIGAVRSVSSGQNEQGELVNLVRIGVDKHLTFRTDAEAQLKKSLLGDSGTINFASLGSPQHPAIDAEKDRIGGVIPPPDLFSQAGYGEKQKQQLAEIMDNAAKGTAKFKGMMENFSGEPYEQLKDVIAKAQAYLKDNQEDVREGVKSARAGLKDFELFSKRLNEEYADKVSKLLDSGSTAMEKGQVILDRVESMLDEARPNIRVAMANFRLASDQLKSTLLEVRRSPWRLLYRPDTRELEFELLYDSARAYADTVTNLRTASEALESLANAGGITSDTDRQTIDELVKNLDASRARYQEAEKAFLELIKKKNEQ